MSRAFLVQEHCLAQFIGKEVAWFCDYSVPPKRTLPESTPRGANQMRLDRTGHRFPRALGSDWRMRQAKYRGHHTVSFMLSMNEPGDDLPLSRIVIDVW